MSNRTLNHTHSLTQFVCSDHGLGQTYRGFLGICCRLLEHYCIVSMPFLIVLSQQRQNTAISNHCMCRNYLGYVTSAKDVNATFLVVVVDGSHSFCICPGSCRFYLMISESKLQFDFAFAYLILFFLSPTLVHLHDFSVSFSFK